MGPAQPPFLRRDSDVEAFRPFGRWVPMPIIFLILVLVDGSPAGFTVIFDVAVCGVLGICVAVAMP